MGELLPTHLRSKVSKKNQQEKKNPLPLRFPWIFIVGGVALALLFFSGNDPTKQISYGDFITNLREDKVQNATFDNTNGSIQGRLNSEEFFATNAPTPPPDADLELMTSKGVKFETPSPNPLLSLIGLLLPVIIIIGFFLWLQNRSTSPGGGIGGVMSIMQTKAKLHNPEQSTTKFEDVAGYESVKQEISEVVNFLKEPEKFSAVGARVPKGILLVGPPGTGKTLLARAVAGEAGVSFLSMTGSDFMEMFVGVGASRVRDLYSKARKEGKAIIFIDEIDSIGRKRGAGLGGGHDEREQTLNQLLSEMDGFEAAEGIVVMAATNRADILDPALLRPGRFDRQIVVPLPELEDRKKILEVHLKGKQTSSDVDVEVIARGTPGMSGADLSNLVNEAALFAVREGKTEITMADFDNARDRVLMGVKRDSMAMTDEEKEAVAYHEAGHAICAAALPNADPVHKVTIIPSGMALGVTQQLPEGDRHLYRQDYIEDSLVVRLGGRIAEEVVYGVISTGANNDLVGATELARKMVREWGMSERVGPMAWGNHGQVFLGEDIMHSREYSDDTARVIDEEVERILREQQDRCRKLLTEYRPALDALAKALLEKETVEGSEVNKMVEENGTKPALSASSAGTTEDN